MVAIRQIAATIYSAVRFNAWYGYAPEKVQDFQTEKFLGAWYERARVAN